MVLKFLRKVKMLKLRLEMKKAPSPPKKSPKDLPNLIILWLKVVRRFITTIVLVILFILFIISLFK